MAAKHRGTKAQRHREVVAYIALGSNLGDRRAMLERAVEGLRTEAGVKVGEVSIFYETVPVGGPAGQGEYLNGVVEVATSLSAQELLDRLLLLEQRLGRKRQEHWGPRCIDLDLLLYGQQVISQEKLEVPHRLMHEREFVLRGLAQIAPQVRHPVLGLTAKEMWQKVRTKN